MNDDAYYLERRCNEENESMVRFANASGAKLSPDGNQWCYLLGEDIIIGVAAFGDTPFAAAKAFYKAFMSERNAGLVHVVKPATDTQSGMVKFRDLLMSVCEMLQIPRCTDGPCEDIAVYKKEIEWALDDQRMLDALRRADKAEAGMKDAVALIKAASLASENWPGVSWPPLNEVNDKMYAFLKQHGGAS